MHQIRFPLGLRPRPRSGSLYSAPPNPLAAFKGERKGESREGRKGRRRKGEREERAGSANTHVSTSAGGSRYVRA